MTRAKKEPRPRCGAKSKQTGLPCKNYVMEGKTRCKFHGGAAGGDGRPIVHGLYADHVPAEWKDTYEYFKTDPEYLSSRAEIAVGQTNFARFLKRCEGMVLNAETVEYIGAHIERIVRLKEKEAKRVHNERVVSEILAKQVAREAEILGTILNKYLDGERASAVAAEFATVVEQECCTSAGLPLTE